MGRPLKFDFIFCDPSFFCWTRLLISKILLHIHVKEPDSQSASSSLVRDHLPHNLCHSSSIPYYLGNFRMGGLAREEGRISYVTANYKPQEITISSTIKAGINSGYPSHPLFPRVIISVEWYHSLDLLRNTKQSQLLTIGFVFKIYKPP